MVTAGIDMRNASVYVGSDATSVLANTRVAVRSGGVPRLPWAAWAGRSCTLRTLPPPPPQLVRSRRVPRAARRAAQSGLSLAAGQQLAVAAGATLGRYVIIYTGSTEEGTLGLDDVQVYTMGERGQGFRQRERALGWRRAKAAPAARRGWRRPMRCRHLAHRAPPRHRPAETNAAANKQVSSSASLGALNGGALEAVVDNNASTCVTVDAAAGSTPGAGMCRCSAGLPVPCRCVARGSALADTSPARLLVPPRLSAARRLGVSGSWVRGAGGRSERARRARHQRADRRAGLRDKERRREPGRRAGMRRGAQPAAGAVDRGRLQQGGQVRPEEWAGRGRACAWPAAQGRCRHCLPSTRRRRPPGTGTSSCNCLASRAMPPWSCASSKWPSQSGPRAAAAAAAAAVASAAAPSRASSSAPSWAPRCCCWLCRTCAGGTAGCSTSACGWRLWRLRRVPTQQKQQEQQEQQVAAPPLGK